MKFVKYNDNKSVTIPPAVLTVCGLDDEGKLEMAGAKGAGIFQTTAANKNRLTKVLYRAPFSDHWEAKTWDFAIKRISENIKKERDASFMLSNKDGARVNRLETIGQMGSSNLDSEECWNIAAFARTLGLVYLEHQARV